MEILFSCFYFSLERQRKKERKKVRISFLAFYLIVVGGKTKKEKTVKEFLKNEIITKKNYFEYLN